MIEPGTSTLTRDTVGSCAGQAKMAGCISKKVPVIVRGKFGLAPTVTRRWEALFSELPAAASSLAMYCASAQKRVVAGGLSAVSTSAVATLTRWSETVAVDPPPLGEAGKIPVVALTSERRPSGRLPLRLEL